MMDLEAWKKEMEELPVYIFVVYLEEASPPLPRVHSTREWWWVPCQKKVSGRIKSKGDGGQGMGVKDV